eukprot:COSAG05_NODE_1415_length_4942_cov_9.721484_2_plen_158_part_00
MLLLLAYKIAIVGGITRIYDLGVETLSRLATCVRRYRFSGQLASPYRSESINTLACDIQLLPITALRKEEFNVNNPAPDQRASLKALLDTIRIGWDATHTHTHTHTHTQTDRHAHTPTHTHALESDAHAHVHDKQVTKTRVGERDMRNRITIPMPLS